jgi:hypothetical protein
MCNCLCNSLDVFTRFLSYQFCIFLYFFCAKMTGFISEETNCNVIIVYMLSPGLLEMQDCLVFLVFTKNDPAFLKVCIYICLAIRN